MRFSKCIAVSAVLIPVLTMTACNDDQAETGVAEAAVASEVQLESMEDKLSYLMGYSVAKQVADAGLSINSELVIRAIDDVQNERESLVSEEQMRIVGEEFKHLIQERRITAVREKNSALGEQYRSKNAEREGVTQLESGIQYEVLASGKAGAKKPTASDSVKVHYHGTLIDGTVFDSSVEAGKPVTFGVSQVIAGWTEVLQLMSEGDKWRVVIPSALAYPDGTRAIQPGSTLIFEIELLEVNPAS